MSQVQPTPASTRQRLATMLAPIATDLLAVEELLQLQLQNRHHFVNDLVTHSSHMSGKRLRPALLLLAAKAVGDINESHRTLAAVVEMDPSQDHV